MNPPPPAPPDPVIEMDTVSIGSLHDPGASVIEAIEWTVRKGEFWVIAGHNGSGKSDLLLTLAGLMAPLAGRYRCLGEPMPTLEDARPGHRLKVGLVFGGGRLLNRLNLGDNVALPVRYHEDLDEASALHRVMPILQATGLTSMAARMPGTLGRHWHQRAGLARALATNPELLLLDDPLSGLDSPHAAWWIRFLQDAHGGRQPFCSRDMTLVLATDTLAPWRQVATHCALLEAGRLVSMGCPNAPDVSGHPKIREYSGPGRWTFDPAG